MKNKIILCNFIAGCGKDTFADYLVKKYGFIKLAFADKIYDIAKELFNMENKDRKLLIDIGQKMREINPNVWIDYTFKIANSYLEDGIPVVISDCRQLNEYQEAIKRDFYPIRIVCDKEIAVQRLIKRDGFCDESLLDNESENGTRNIKMMEIHNNGTLEEFYKKIDELMDNQRPYIPKLTKTDIFNYCKKFY